MLRDDLSPHLPPNRPEEHCIKLVPGETLPNKAPLQGLYKIENTTRILLIQHQLYTLELDEGGSVHDHITKVKVVRDQLAAIGHRVDSAQQALMVMHRLPKSYRGFVTTVTANERYRPLTFDELAPLLM